jgi:hypothetical protein
MSGIKVVSVTAGAAPSGSTTAALGLAALVPAAGLVMATGAVVVAGVAIAKMAKGAFDAYQTRLRQEQERAEQREREIQQRILQIRSQIQTRQRKVNLNLPQSTPAPTHQPSTNVTSSSTIKPDHQRKIQEQKARLPKIRAEYQTLIEQQILDEQTVNQSFNQTEQALNTNNLEQAQSYLQALDDARIAAIKELELAWQSQLDYLQERLDQLENRLPFTIHQEMQNQIHQARKNWHSLTDEILQSWHQQMSELAAQAERIEIAADNMITAWHQVGYETELVGFDHGDALIATDTHEGAKTVTRIQFYGQQIELKTPSEEPEMSCAARTSEVLQLFEQQGYYLEWENWDEQPVTEEWRQLNQTSDVSEEETENYPSSSSSSRRSQQQEY